MVLPAEIQIDDGCRSGQARHQAPDVFGIQSETAGRQNQPGTGKGHQYHHQGNSVTLLLEEDPGKDGDKQRVGHVEDVGLGHRGRRYRFEKTKDRSTIRKGSPEQQVVIDNVQAALPNLHDGANHYKSQ